MKDEETKKKIIIAAIAVVILIIILLLVFLLKTKQYMVSFNTNGGNEIVSVIVKENEKVQKPEDPIREGYIFAGWYYNGELYDFETLVKQDMTLLAEWAVQGNAEVEEITLEKTELSIKVGETSTLTAKIFPDDAKPTKLKWTSSDENILTVDENGNIKALKEGKATVTVTTEDEKYTANCTVTVTAEEPSPTPSTQPSTKPSTKPSQAPTQPSKGPTQQGQESSTVQVTGVTLTGASQVNVKNSITLTASVQPSNATNKNVTWSSSNPSVASVNNGVVTGLSEGETTITVTTADGSYTATHTVTVKSVYRITFTDITDAESRKFGLIFYSITVTKDGVVFNGYNSITYNGRTQAFKSSQSISGDWINKSEYSALINIGSKQVNATVSYN